MGSVGNVLALRCVTTGLILTARSVGEISVDRGENLKSHDVACDVYDVICTSENPFYTEECARSVKFPGLGNC